jgi:hypothetical protein
MIEASEVIISSQPKRNVRWKKLGRIWETTPTYSWMQSHSANPVAELLGDGDVRVYFSCRDEFNISSIATIEFNLANPQQSVLVSDEPILGPGPIGAFDDNGSSMGCLLHVNGKRYLYYLGWNLGVTVPWRNSIGLAISDGLSGPFEKVSLAPILDRNATDPFSISYPWVTVDENENRWQMWYGSNLKWGPEQRDMAHVLKYAESQDGIHWHPGGDVLLPLQEPWEYAQSKPCVLKDRHGYRLWYSFRGERYRIGYAESEDGRIWNRLDAYSGIDISSDGWDSEVVCYPNVFEWDGKLYMLYNGNSYGKTGIGLAVQED